MPIFAGGVIEDTGRGLDLAIEGHGLLAVWLPSGETGYTRDGRLHVNKDDKLVNTQDWVVRPGITVPSDLLKELSIDVEGHVSGRTAGTPDSMTQLGQLTISRLHRPRAAARGLGRVDADREVGGSDHAGARARWARHAAPGLPRAVQRARGRSWPS